VRVLLAVFVLSLTDMVSRSRRETYRGSEFAGRVLADEGIPVVMKVRLL